MPILTTLDKVRLEIGDVDPDAPLFNDDELSYIVETHADHVLNAAAHACDVLATRFARDYDFEWQGAGESARGKFSRSQMSKQFADRAVALRERAQAASGGIAVIEITRVDGYSDDLSTRDGAGGIDAVTGRRSWVPDPDLPQ